MKRCLSLAIAVCVLAAGPSAARRYDVTRDGGVVRLSDAGTTTTVSIMPTVGNIAFDMQVKGQRVLRNAQADAAGFKASPNGTGIPFMGPWINRLDERQR